MDRKQSSSIFFAALIASLILVVLMYYKIFHKLILQWWNDPNYSHGFLIIPISLYLLWSRKDEFVRLKPEPSWYGVVVLLFAGILYILGQIAGELFTQRISLIIITAGLVLSFGGIPLWKITRASIAYLLFMVPLPYIVYDSIAFPLKLMATKISMEALQLIGISIFSEGNIIYLPNITLEVADACSGIRSLVSVLALSVIIAIKMHKLSWKRYLLVFLSIPIVLFCNILRIVVTGILASYNPELSRGFFHSFSGELIFIAGVFMILGMSILMREENSKKEKPDTLNTENKLQDMSSIQSLSASPAVPLTGVMVLICAWLITLQSANVTAKPIEKPLANFPNRIDGFHKVADGQLDKKILSVLGVDEYLIRTFDGPDSYPVTLYIGYFEDQKEGAMIHSPKHCYPGSGWFPLSSKIIELKLPGSNRSIRINEYILKRGDTTELVYYWYHSRGRVIANEYVDRVYMILDSITKKRSDGALIRISGPADDLERAKGLQRRFIQKLFSVLDDFLPS